MYSLDSISKFDNLVLAYDRLLTNPESTYKNFFRDTYSAYGMASDTNISMLRKKLKSGYLPMPTIRVYMPKANGLSRMYTLLSIEDQIVYQAYANVLANALCSNPKIRKRYKKSVFGNLFSDESSKFFYLKWQDSYKAYTQAIINAFEEGNKYIASFDLTACYDSINHHLLWTILKEKCSFNENCATSFIQLIEKWESSEGQELGTGIPQGPLASGIVAEAVLAEYDAYIETLQKKYSFQYFRYVDDIRVLADDETVVRWVLFLLDKKSKELGLFPQSSKIAIHEITNIEDEVKRISKPLFEDEFDDEKKPDIAVNSIKSLLKGDPADLTTIKRYFQYVKHGTKANSLAIAAVSSFPNLIHSFGYYVQRYPRKIPPKISNYIYQCCLDKTQQFSAGILLEASINKLSKSDIDRFLQMAKEVIERDKKDSFIYDCRFKAELICIVLQYDMAFGKRIKNYLEKCNWWVKGKIIYYAQKNNLIPKLGTSFLEKMIMQRENELALAAANYFLLAKEPYKLPVTGLIAPIAQNTLKQAGLIQRNRYSTSQINRYLEEIVGVHSTFQWKKKLGKEHDQIERTIFAALGYWKTDLTAFVNLWDTIDDKLLYLLTQAHPELGGYQLGKIGGLKTSNTLKTKLPEFYKMCMHIHDLRLSSHLSHSEIKGSHEYTGPISNKKRKMIFRILKAGLREVLVYW